MGGQACVFYDAAEFSRDCDIVLMSDDANLGRLAFALEALGNRTIKKYQRTHSWVGQSIHAEVF